MKLLVINPGSTSTKISLYDDDKELFTKSIYHDADVINKYDHVNEQIPFRKKVIIGTLKDYGYDLKDIDVFIGRGGSAFSQKEGVTIIDSRLYEDTKNAVGGSIHPAKLGVMIAYEFGSLYNKPMYTLNPTNTDELCDLARFTGIKGVYREASLHALNQKAVAREYARRNNKNYEDLNLIVCHIDGGITITAHQKGKMIDSNVGSGGDGPFSPTRIGSIPISTLLDYLKSHSFEETRDLTTRRGGFVSFFNTSNAEKIREKINKGDTSAKLVWDAMIYNIAKEIGAMASVLKGEVDQIILTGGYIRFKDLVDDIKSYSNYIADITCIEDLEQETFAIEVNKVLNGEIKARVYSGKPVFKGFKGIDF